VRLHVLANADHWLHVDNPAGLEALMESELKKADGSDRID
jgi:hypothetical protein